MAEAGDDPFAVDEQHEVLRGLRATVKENLPLLLQPKDAWQPTDFLPDLSAEDWREQLERFREPAMNLSDEVLVVVVGDMVTEEALPNYAVSLNLIAEDETGTSDDPWAVWLRGWTAEENRHGDLLNAFLRLTGRVDMRSIELTVHHLIANGFNPQAAQAGPYAGLIYTSFQERATKISHVNVGRLAAKDGDASLGKICKRIAGDESRHEAFYTRMMGEVMARDPERGVLVFRDMLRRIIAMPGKLMDDGEDPDLFDHFAAVAQRLDVYTVYDYADIIRHLVSTWKVASLPLSGKAAAAQTFLCRQAERLESFAERVTEEAKLAPKVKFSWIYNRMA
jgi:acyl-[acyl-carrier-protein] desaturase